MSGWNDLGQILGGGGKIGQAEVYQDQLGKNYQNFALLEKAKHERSINMARDSLPASMERLGYKQELAQIMLANNAPSMSQLGNAQNPNFYRGHEAAWKASGLDGGTRNLGDMSVGQSIASGKALDSVSVQGGYRYNKYDPNTPMQLTDLGQADLNATNSRANASNASANLTKNKQDHPERYKTAPKSGAKPKPKDKYVSYKTVGGKKYGKDKKGDWYQIDE